MRMMSNPTPPTILAWRSSVNNFDCKLDIYDYERPVQQTKASDILSLLPQGPQRCTLARGLGPYLRDLEQP